jgi:hypothetical protein
MFKSFSYITISLTLLLVSCSGSENYHEAYGFEQDGKSFIKLKGKRTLMAHDPGSLLSNKTYEDSLVLQVPSLGDGTIAAKDIPVPKGYYKLLGEINVQGKKVQVHLSYDNTDDKKTEPLS